MILKIFTAYIYNGALFSWYFSLKTLCDASLSAEKKLKLVVTAEKVFGEKASWNSSSIKELCNLIETLNPREMLSLKAKEVFLTFCFYLWYFPSNF